jgi:Mg-chelatase subunit ChlI
MGETREPKRTKPIADPITRAEVQRHADELLQNPEYLAEIWAETHRYAEEMMKNPEYVAPELLRAERDSLRSENERLKQALAMVEQLDGSADAVALAVKGIARHAREGDSAMMDPSLLAPAVESNAEEYAMLPASELAAMREEVERLWEALTEFYEAQREQRRPTQAAINFARESTPQQPV